MSRLDRTRRALLDAATLVLSKDAAASLGEVATVAGVGRTTLYRYFPTREDLIRALVEDALDRIAQAITEARPTEGPVLEALRRVADTVIPLGPSLRFLNAEPDVYAAAHLMRRWYDALAPITDAVKRGQASGAIRSDLPTSWIVDAFAGSLMTAWDSVSEGRLAPNDAPRLVLDTVLNGVARGEVQS